MATDYHGYPVPIGTAAPFVHLDIKALADAVDKDIPIIVNNLAARDALPGLLNLKALVKSQNYAMYVHDGTKWIAATASAPRHLELSSTFNVAGGLSNWDVGALSVANSNTFNNSHADTAGALSGAFTFREKGLYSVTFMSLPSSNPGRSGLLIKDGGGLSYGSSFTDGLLWEMTATCNGVFNAGQYLRGVLVQTNATTNNTRVSVTKLASLE